MARVAFRNDGGVCVAGRRCNVRGWRSRRGTSISPGASSPSHSRTFGRVMPPVSSSRLSRDAMAALINLLVSPPLRRAMSVACAGWQRCEARTPRTPTWACHTASYSRIDPCSYGARCVKPVG
jgi:hypothetical protein